MKLNQLTNKAYIDLLNSATDLSRPVGKYKSRGFAEEYIGLMTHRSGFYGQIKGDAVVALKKGDTTFYETDTIYLQIEGVVELGKEPVNIGDIEYKGYGVLIVDGVSIFDGRSSEGTAPVSYTFENGLTGTTTIGWGGVFDSGSVRIQGNGDGTILELGRLTSRLEDCRFYTSESFRIDIDNGIIDQRLFFDEGGSVYTIKDDTTDNNLSATTTPLSSIIDITNNETGELSIFEISDERFFLLCKNNTLQLDETGFKINGNLAGGLEVGTKSSTDPNNKSGLAADSTYLYIYTGSGWGRIALETGYSGS